MLSEAFWRQRFGADPVVLGRSLALSGQATRVVGVMPAAFDFLDDEVDLWVPVATARRAGPSSERGTNNFDAIGRLRPGIALEAARAELVAITTRLAREYPKTNARKIVEPMSAARVRDRAVAARAAGAAGRRAAGGARRERQRGGAAARASRRARRRVRGARRHGSGIAPPVRAGAGRERGARARGWRLGGGARGLGPRRAAGAGARQPAAGRAPSRSTRACSASPSASPWWPPCWRRRCPRCWPRARRPARCSRARAGARSGAGATGRALSTLVVGEVALAGVLLVGSLLLVRSFLRLQAVPLGFDPRGTLTADVVLPESRYGTRAPQTRAVTEIVRQLEAAPGVEAAAWVTTPPLDARGGLGGTILIDGRTFVPTSSLGARCASSTATTSPSRGSRCSAAGASRARTTAVPRSRSSTSASRAASLAGRRRRRPAHRLPRLRRRRGALLDDDRGRRLRHQGAARSVRRTG